MANKKNNSIQYNVFKTWSPTFKDPPGGDLHEYRQYIYDHIKFSNVLKALKLRPEECPTNRYSHKMICPFKFHKNGRERTGSFRFSDKKQIFTCFGCNESGDILRFLSLYCGGCEQYHLKKLISFAKLSDNIEQWEANNVEIDDDIKTREATQQIQFNIGLILREYLKSIEKNKYYINECEWVDQMFIKIDKYFDGVAQDDLESAKKVYEKINNSIIKRKSKIGV